MARRKGDGDAVKVLHQWIWNVVRDKVADMLSGMRHQRGLDYEEIKELRKAVKDLRRDLSAIERAIVSVADAKDVADKLANLASEENRNGLALCDVDRRLKALEKRRVECN